MHFVRHLRLSTGCSVYTVFLATLAFLYAGQAMAGMYAYSKRPYTDVGVLNKSLSSACKRREFSQIRKLHLAIGYNGPEGMGITGIAKFRWNLFDPNNLSQPGYTYHFYHDGYSDCRVYIAGTRMTR